ncbi:MAG: cyclo(L-tyrosyl-L-tyrosyl) synthase [Candidatus Woesearchaeota archaeon]|jgi:cyclo(L-tyrosyl-L-tyrosyl) synthase
MQIQGGFTGIACKKGYDVAANNGFAIVAMSPGNSYFKKERIAELLHYCACHFDQVRILIPDKPAQHTYRAMGYSEKRACKKARLNSNALKNHSLASIKNLLDNVQLIDWESDVSTKESYKRELESVLTMYEHNMKFKNAVRETTRKVLEHKLKEGIDLDTAIDEGVYYLLKELAFLSACPQMYEIRNATYVYHDRWKVFEDFVGGVFDGKIRNKLGFIIIN